MRATTVVVPCYNEAERLDPASFLRASAMLSDTHFLFVNDGSRDATAERLEALARQLGSRGSTLHLSQNSGKAEAVRQGLLKALERRPQRVAYWDADLATPLDELPRFSEVFDRHPAVEVVLGSRLRLLGHRIDRRPARRLLGAAFAKAASLVLRFSLRDTQCGAKMFRVTPALQAVLAEPFGSRWIFDVELLARLTATGTREDWAERIYECPLDEWREVPGSKLRSRDFLRAGSELWSIYRQDMSPYRAALARRGTAPVVPAAEFGRAARDSQRSGQTDREAA